MVLTVNRNFQVYGFNIIIQGDDMNLLSGIAHGWHNVVNANGVMITVVGMLLVFFSLSLISLIIKSTPYLLKIIDRYFPEEDLHSSGNNVKKVSETEIVAAISTALHYSSQSLKK